MFDQPKARPLRASQFFEDGGASRPVVEHTVARGHRHEDEHFSTGRIHGVLVETFPFAITRDVLERGRERFDIYCAPCHGTTGKGDGVIVQRGFPPPASLHDDRLRQASAGYHFEVISNGFGTMYPFASRIEAGDRWAIIAYIRALQFSQHARLSDVQPEERQKLEAMP
jgi:cytochrome c553